MSSFNSCLTLSILGPPPEELIVASKSSIGYDIIRNMGGLQKGKIAKETKKKTYGAAKPTQQESEDLFAITDVKRDFPTGSIKVREIIFV